MTFNKDPFQIDKKRKKKAITIGNKNKFPSFSHYVVFFLEVNLMKKMNYLGIRFLTNISDFVIRQKKNRKKQKIENKNSLIYL